MLVKAKNPGTSYIVGNYHIGSEKFVEVDDKAQTTIKRAQETNLFEFEFGETSKNKLEGVETKEDTKEAPGDIKKLPKAPSKMNKDEIMNVLNDFGIEFNPEDKVTDLRKLLTEEE